MHIMRLFFPMAAWIIGVALLFALDYFARWILLPSMPEESSMRLVASAEMRLKFFIISGQVIIALACLVFAWKCAEKFPLFLRLVYLTIMIGAGWMLAAIMGLYYSVELVEIDTL